MHALPVSARPSRCGVRMARDCWRGFAWVRALGDGSCLRWPASADASGSPLGQAAAAWRDAHNHPERIIARAATHRPTSPPRLRRGPLGRGRRRRARRTRACTASPSAWPQPTQGQPPSEIRVVTPRHGPRQSPKRAAPRLMGRASQAPTRPSRAARRLRLFPSHKRRGQSTPCCPGQEAATLRATRESRAARLPSG